MEDKTFQITTTDGEVINCEIISLVPNPDDAESPYIIYTDYKTDNGYKILCGQLIENDGVYTINKITDEIILDYLKEHLSEEMIDQIEKNKEVSQND